MVVSDALGGVGRRVRTARRGARRLVEGGRGLGIRAVGGWAVGRITRRPLPAENTSLTWVVADESASTRVFLADYWGDTYGIVGPAFEATLFDESGRVVDAWSIELEADSTVVVDIRERCTSAGVPLPFSGQLLLRLRDERLVPGRPVQVFAEYGDASGGVSGVHGQYGLMTVPAAQVLCAMRAEGEEGMRTGVVVMNPYVGPGSPHPMRTTMTLVADDGRHVSHQLDPVDPMTSRTVYIDEVFPGSAELLGGRTGHLRLSVPCPSSRVATFCHFSRRPSCREPRHHRPGLRSTRGCSSVVDGLMAARELLRHRRPASGHTPEPAQRLGPGAASIVRSASRCIGLMEHRSRSRRCRSRPMACVPSRCGVCSRRLERRRNSRGMPSSGSNPGPGVGRARRRSTFSWASRSTNSSWERCR